MDTVSNSGIAGAVRPSIGNSRGVSAVEFAIIAPVLIIMVMNLYDFSAYAFQLMQVANASEIGAEAAWEACPPGNQPAIFKCGTSGATLTAAVGAAIASTSLGTGVSLDGSVAEAYYCADTATNTLRFAGNVTSSSSPPSCGGTAFAGDYITVSVKYAYSPLFSGSPFSVASVLPTPIRSSSMFRLN